MITYVEESDHFPVRTTTCQKVLLDLPEPSFWISSIALYLNHLNHADNVTKRTLAGDAIRRFKIRCGLIGRP
jgi:hypothetical protein